MSLQPMKLRLAPTGVRRSCSLAEPCGLTCYSKLSDEAIKNVGTAAASALLSGFSCRHGWFSVGDVAYLPVSRDLPHRYAGQLGVVTAIRGG